MKRSLRKYQKEALKFCLKKQNPALFLDMRLGKTLITLRSLMIKLYKQKNYKVLIVSPLSALNSWKTELLKEGFTESDIINLTGEFTKEERKKQLQKTGKFYLMNKEGCFVIPEVKNLKWNCVILDESTFIKSPGKINNSRKYGKRPNIAKFFMENFSGVKYKYILTGTPIPSSELDIYNQLTFINPSVFPVKNYWEFRFRYFLQLPCKKWVVSKSGKDVINNVIKNNSFRLSRKQVNFGGEKIYEKRVINFPAKIEKIYKGIKDNFISEVDGKVYNVTDFNLVKFIWLRRLTGGYLQKENDLQFIFDGKLKEIKYLLSTELKNDSVVIWANFISEIDLLNKNIKDSRIINGKVKPETRIKRINDFNKGKFNIIICQPGALQFGVDLSKADTEIYYSSPLSLETRLQSEDRLINSKSESTLIIDLLINKTIDKSIYKSLIKKESKQKQYFRIMESLKC